MRKIFAAITVMLLSLAASWPAPAQLRLPRAGAEDLADVLQLSDASRQMSFTATSLTNCGADTRPVIFVTAMGTYEYRWCVNVPGASAWMDIYAYSSGSFRAKGSYPIACGWGMPSEVSSAVKC